MARYIRFVTIFSLAFGLSSICCVFLLRMIGLHDIPHGQYLKKCLIGSLFGGVVLVSCSMLMEWYALRGISDKKAARKPHAERTVVAALSYHEAFGRVLAALEEVRPVVLDEDRENGVVVARTPMSWKSFGEIVRIGFRELDSARTEVVVSSRPKRRLTLIDYGKSFQNVSRICQGLSSAA